MKNKKAIFVLTTSLLLCACGGNKPASSSQPSVAPSSEPSSQPSAATTYRITLTQGEHYTIAAAEGYDPNAVEEGSNFKFTVVADANYKIVEVKAGESVLMSSNGTYTIPRVNENTTVTVEVAVEHVSITLPSGTGYKAEAAPGYNAEEVAKGGDFKFKVTAEAHYVIKGVKADGVALAEEDGLYTINNVVAPVEITVDCEEETHSLTIVEGSLYEVEVLTVGADLTKLPYSSEVQVKITAISGYHIKSVLLNGTAIEGNEGVYTIKNLESDSTLIVNAAINIFTVTLPSDSTYTITVSDGYDPTNIAWGADFKFSVEVSEHHHIVSVKAGSTELVASGSEYTISDIKTDIVVTVEAEEDTYSIEMPSAKYYDINILSSGIDLSKVAYSQEVRFEVTAKDHCQVLSVKLNGEALEAVEGVYTIKNQTSNAVVTVESTIDTYSITLQTGEHFSIAAAEGYDASKVEHGDDFAFSVTPEESYRIISVKAGESEVSKEDDNYIIKNVTSNLTVSVEVELIHEHNYDKYGTCEICGKYNLISTIADQSKLSVETPEDVELPSQFEKMYKYSKGGYFNGVSIFSNFNISGLSSFSFYLANKGLDDKGDNYTFNLREGDPNDSSTQPNTSGFGAGVCGTVTATQTAKGQWTLTTDATDKYGRKGFFSTVDWQPHDIPLVYDNVTTIDQLLIFASWDQSVYISDINATPIKGENLGFPAADASKVTDEAPEGVSCSKSFGVMHKYSKGGYFDGFGAFNDVDISSYSSLKFLISNNGVDGNNETQFLFINEETIESTGTPKVTGIGINLTCAIYAENKGDGTWSLTTNQTDVHNRKGFFSTADYGPHDVAIEINEVAKLNDLIKISSWNYSFFMSDITAYK